MDMIGENKQREGMEIGFEKKINGEKKVLKVLHLSSKSIKKVQDNLK